jgi:hypothetical protein
MLHSVGSIASLGACLQETGDPIFLAKQKAQVKVATPHNSPGVPLKLHSRRKKERWMMGDEGRRMMMVMKE